MFLQPAYKLILATCLATGCIFLQGCTNSEKDIADLDKKKKGVEEVIRVDINYTQAGKAKAKLLSPLMYRVQDTMPYVEFPKTLHVDFYDEFAQKESILDAKYGMYKETQSRVVLRDSVRFIGLKNGDTLYCDELYWDRNRPVYQFYTDKPVRIRTKTHIIDGTGLETKQDFSEKWIKNVTNSYIRVPSAQFPQN